MCKGVRAATFRFGNPQPEPSFSGRPDGHADRASAYAIVQLFEQEDVAMAFDLHEASPEYPVINTIVAHPA